MSLSYLTLQENKLDLNIQCNNLKCNSIDMLEFNAVNYTPSLSSSNSNLVATYTLQRGRYTKIGNTIIYQFKIAGTISGGTGNLLVSCPIASANLNLSSVGTLVKASANPAFTSATSPFLQMVGGTTTIQIMEQTPAGASANVAVSNVTFEFLGSIIYFTA